MILRFALKAHLTPVADDVLDPVQPSERHPQMPLVDADLFVAYSTSAPAERCVLEDLAALTVVCGPWDAARTKFNPINDEEATHVA